MNQTVVRNAEEKDFKAIEAIYAEQVLHGFATFETVPPSADELMNRWHAILDKGLPYLIASINDNVVGYVYASPYRARPAYQYSIENSIYVSTDARGKGIGKLLLRNLIEQCEKGPWRQMIGIVGDSENKASIALHASAGFEHVGVLKAVGFKFDRWVDTVIMQRSIG